jgi:uncharacterized protein
MASIPSISKSDRNNRFVLRRSVYISLAFFAAVIVLRSIDLFILKLDGLPDKMIVSQVLGFLLVLGYLWALRKPLAALGLNSKNFGYAFVIGGFSLVVLYMVLYAVQFYLLATTGESPRLMFGTIDAETGISSSLFATWFFVFGQIMNSFTEEGIFRGVMLPQFMRRMSFWRANALQASLFGLAHLVFPLHGWVSGQTTINGTLAEAALLMVATTVGGLVFGYLYYRTGNLWTSWFAHTIDNVVLLVFHIQTVNRLNAETDIAMLARIGYLLMVILAWAIARRSNLTPLKPWGQAEISHRSVTHGEGQRNVG